MDGMSGIDTIRNLTKIMPNLRFIVSSGHAIGQNEIPIELHDRVSFLQKPYRANELSELVMSLIKRR
jgi:DNA-binding NtrC family response regulator